MSEPAATPRRRGNVSQRGNSLQVRVFAGVDPVTGKDVYLTASVQGTDKAAQRKADKALTRLMSQVDQQRAASSSVPFGYTINEWLRTAELEESTREMYRGYVE